MRRRAGFELPPDIGFPIGTIMDDRRVGAGGAEFVVIFDEMSHRRFVVA
jgi:hypothetical protein